MTFMISLIPQLFTYTWCDHVFVLYLYFGGEDVIPIPNWQDHDTFSPWRKTTALMSEQPNYIDKKCFVIYGYLSKNRFSGT